MDPPTHFRIFLRILEFFYFLKTPNYPREKSGNTFLCMAQRLYTCIMVIVAHNERRCRSMSTYCATIRAIADIVLRCTLRHPNPNPDLFIIDLWPRKIDTSVTPSFASLGGPVHANFDCIYALQNYRSPSVTERRTNGRAKFVIRPIRTDTW